jgi:hypothetical protein
MATPVLKAKSKEVTHLGPVGSGAKMKLINNFLCGVQVASLAEGLAWIERSGLDRDNALSILKAGAGGVGGGADVRSPSEVKRDPTNQEPARISTCNSRTGRSKARHDGIACNPTLLLRFWNAQVYCCPWDVQRDRIVVG